MIRLKLPLHSVPRDLPFSELEQIRANLYAKKGRRLVEKCLTLLENLEKDHLDIDSLVEINDLSMTLAAMNSKWNSFSLSVFMNFMAYTQNSPAELRTVFNETLKALAPPKLEA